MSKKTTAASAASTATESKATKGTRTSAVKTEAKRYAILQAMAKNPNGVTRDVLAEAAGSNSDINVIAKQLVDEGLAIRERDAEVGAGYVYKITAKGTKQAAKEKAKK